MAGGNRDLAFGAEVLSQDIIPVPGFARPTARNLFPIGELRATNRMHGQ
jgi:hypothetical protein